MDESPQQPKPPQPSPASASAPAGPAAPQKIDKQVLVQRFAKIGLNQLRCREDLRDGFALASHVSESPAVSVHGFHARPALAA